MSCELTPLVDSDSEECGPEYSEYEFYCETCGEYVEGPCDDG